MRRSLAKVRGLGFILWHSRHELYHVLLGLVWAWFLRERWHEFNPKWIWLSVFGSLLPDLDHINYFLTYGRRTDYTDQIKNMLKSKQWRNLTVFIEHGHKNNTNLYSHNFYVVMIVLAFAFMSIIIDWESGVVLFGSVLIHYLFDVFDDLTQLGEINENWRRWGKKKSK